MFALCVLGMEDGCERMSLSITPRNDAARSPSAKQKQPDEHHKVNPFPCLVSLTSVRHGEGGRPARREYPLYGTRNHVASSLQFPPNNGGVYPTSRIVTKHSSQGYLENGILCRRDKYRQRSPCIDAYLCFNFFLSSEDTNSEHATTAASESCTIPRRTSSPSRITSEDTVPGGRRFSLRAQSFPLL